MPVARDELVQRQPTSSYLRRRRSAETTLRNDPDVPVRLPACDRQGVGVDCLTVGPACALGVAIGRFAGHECIDDLADILPHAGPDTAMAG